MILGLTDILGETSQAELFQKISDICTSVNNVKDARQLLDLSLKRTLDLFGARRGSVFIIKENKKELILSIAQGMKMDEQKIMVKKLGEGVVGKVAQIKKPIIVTDITKDSRFRDFKARGSYRTPSFICAPLIIKDQLIGVINISDKTSGAKFNENELQLLDFLASQIALNYRRVELYRKFKTIIKESKNLKSELGKSSAEAQHLKKQIVVQEKFASLGKLAGGIAHEFNNPLDGVIRYTNLSLERLKDDDVVRGYLLEVKYGLNRMANIVRSLLACSRNSQPTMQKVNVNHSIEQVVSSLRGDLSSKDIVVETELSSNLLRITDLGVELVISNLVRNAIDAVDKKGRICISTQLEGEYLIIKVSDTGCGFAPELAEKIFEPFYTTKGIDKGCGLGLTIVSEIVKSYNGKINLESVPKKGSTFTILLPQKVENEKR